MSFAVLVHATLDIEPDRCLGTSSLAHGPTSASGQLRAVLPRKEKDDCGSHTDLHRPQASYEQSSPGKEEDDCRSQAERGRHEVHRATYTEGWRRYVDGNVVSETNRTFIQNLLMATAARTSKEAEDDTDSSSNDELEYDRAT